MKTIAKSFLGVIFLLGRLVMTSQGLSLEAEILKAVKQPLCGKSFSSEVVGKGSMDGFFSDKDFWSIFKLLRKKFPKFVGQSFTFGHSFKKRPIKGFFIGNNSSDEKEKNIVLVDALHHAREVLTLSMMVQILVDSVKTLNKCQKDKFFKNNRIL